jgi:hypothetical protein
MASPAQINANRLNSLKSTGPRTEEGKAASSANSYKHGLTARKIFPAARQEEFDLLARDYHADYRPSTPGQQRLLDTMIFATWNLLRYREIQEQLWETLTRNEGGEAKSMAQAFLDDCKGPRSIDKLHRYMRDLERSHARAQRTLDALREDEQVAILTGYAEEYMTEALKQRRGEAAPASPAPEPLIPASDPAPRTPAPPSGIDFVSSESFFIPPVPPTTARVTAPGYEHLSIRL